MQGMERQTWLLSWMGDGGVDNIGWKDGKGTVFIRGLSSTPRTARTFGRLRETMCRRNEALQGLQLGLATPTPGRDGVL